jgi:2-phosphosulfolactate phosphatase
MPQGAAAIAAPKEGVVYYQQAGFDLRFDWGLEGLLALSPNVDAVVVVDTLSFSTCVDVALGRGGAVYPYRWLDQRLTDFAAEHGAEAACKDRAAAGWTLSPVSLLAIPAGLRLVLPSPNGATLAAAARDCELLTSCLRNAAAVAGWLGRHHRSVAVIAAGERWGDGSLRPALEDMLGAGALLAQLSGRRSPEAEAAVASWRQHRPALAQTMRDCASGRELISRGFGRDVDMAAELDCSATVPRLDDGWFVDRGDLP